MTHNYEKWMEIILKIIFGVALVWSLYQTFYILVTPTEILSSCENYSKAGILSIQFGFVVLWSACLAAVIFPAGPKAQWASLSVGGAGLLSFGWALRNYLTCERLSWTYGHNPLWFFTYPFLLWILWGMFIPYLEKNLRRLWIYGYIGGCVVIWLLHLIPDSNI